jgi:hypothetical protein
MRRIACKALLLHKHDVDREFFEAEFNESFDDYVVRLWGPRAWGDQFAIHVLGLATGISFGIVQNGSNYNPTKGSNETADVTVVWVRRNHFDTVWPLSRGDRDGESGDGEIAPEGNVKELQDVENFLDSELGKAGFNLDLFLEMYEHQMWGEGETIFDEASENENSFDGECGIEREEENREEEMKGAEKKDANEKEKEEKGSERNETKGDEVNEETLAGIEKEDEYDGCLKL